MESFGTYVMVGYFYLDNYQLVNLTQQKGVYFIALFVKFLLFAYQVEWDIYFTYLGLVISRWFGEKDTVFRP